MIKKLIYIIILTVIFANYAYADLIEAEIRYGEVYYAFKPGDEQKFLSNAKVNMQKAENVKNVQERVSYLQEAMHYYFMVEKINNSSIEAQIGLGRIYDELKFDSIAQKHFFKALSLNPKNPGTNYYFANFYYKRNDLINAFTYYKRAYQFGYQNNYYLNKQLATVCEKLADIETAKTYYQAALNLKQNDTLVAQKIKTLNNLNYNSSQYYLFSKK